MLLYLFFYILISPIIFIFLYFIKKNYKNFIYVFKYEYFVFIIFIIIIICYYIIYISFYFLIFFYKNYRYYKYYYPRYNASKFFYYRKIVYFSFWRYLLINIVKFFFSFFIFLKSYIKGFFFKFLINSNFTIITWFYIKLKILTLHHFNYINLYNKFLALLEHVHNFFNLDELIYFFQRRFSLTSNKYIEDPMWEKLGILKFSKKFYVNYPFWNLKNKSIYWFFFFKEFFFVINNKFIYYINKNKNYTNKYTFKLWM